MTTAETPVDVNGVPFPGTFWALWDADGRLLAHHAFKERVHVDVAVAELGYDPHSLPELGINIPKATVAEFTADRWAEFLEAIRVGADTSWPAWQQRQQG